MRENKKKSITTPLLELTTAQKHSGGHYKYTRNIEIFESV